MSSHKKLLMIAYDFPPAANVAIYRTLKFAQYLPDTDWQPFILTASNGKYPTYDERLLSLVPAGIQVDRARSFEWFNVGKNKANHTRPQKRTFFRRAYYWICRRWNFFMIPDNKVTWVPMATIKALRIIDREQIHHVYVTGKPFSAFVIGYFLKKLRGVRLTIDYRDPWTQNLNYFRRSPIHTRIERAQERAIIRASDIVVANTHHNERILVSDFGEGQPRGKFITIHNGFDRDDFAGVSVEKYDKFTITYAGAFYFAVGSTWDQSAGTDIMRTYSPFVFFEALSKVITQRPDIRERLQVNFMGAQVGGYEPMIEKMGLSETIHHLGYLDYEEHLRVLKKSHLMLLVLSKGEKSSGWIPSKFFSYVGSGNPVLALVPEGEVRDIIRSGRFGTTVDPTDVSGTVDAIVEHFDRYYVNREPFPRDEAVAQRYERRALTERLAKALDGST